VTDDQRHRAEWWAQYWDRSETACHTCRFFLADVGSAPESGECRREGPSDGGEWPTISVNDFCGRHEPVSRLHQPPGAWYLKYETDDYEEAALFLKQLNLEAHRAGLKVLARELQFDVNVEWAKLKAQQADETDA